ncbi:rCG35537 [Rattus norvegicus]|uniref:RCG35537 n=1 Tax=Rattus norvegicus TaxID=10116 RepID=A6HI44_RAT|nr:rCG35537 [Rattus norvegicus]
MMPRRGRLLNDSWRRFVPHAPESNQVLTTDCGGNGEFLRLNDLFTKATDFRVM